MGHRPLDLTQITGKSPKPASVEGGAVPNEVPPMTMNPGTRPKLTASV
jgi:hypothetical protein